MRIFPGDKSRALSFTFLAAAAVAGVMGLRALADLGTILKFFSSPVFLPMMKGSVVPLNMPPLADFMVKNTRLFFAFFPFFWLSAFILSLGLLRRAEWARRGSVAMLYLLACAALMLVLFPWLVIPHPLFYGDISLAPEFNAVVLAAAHYLRLLFTAIGGLCLWWALALDRGSARLDFSSKENK
jgi:hypothetical protein